MIIYGVIAQTSIVGLFLAGCIPGIIIGISHCLVAYFVAHKLGYQGTGESFVLKEFLQACWEGKFSLAAPKLFHM